MTQEKSAFSLPAAACTVLFQLGRSPLYYKDGNGELVGLYNDVGYFLFIMSTFKILLYILCVNKISHLQTENPLKMGHVARKMSLCHPKPNFSRQLCD